MRNCTTYLYPHALPLPGAAPIADRTTAHNVGAHQPQCAPKFREEK
jgi:hypothetical protein